MRRCLWLGTQAFQELFPPGAVSQICLSIKEEIYEVETCHRAGMRGGRGRLSSGPWVVGRIFTSCAICNFFYGISFFSFCFALNSIIFTERKEAARAIQTGAQ